MKYLLCANMTFHILTRVPDDIAAVTKILGKEVTLEDGNKYMRTERLLLDFNLGKSRFRIKDYLNDGNILGKERWTSVCCLRREIKIVYAVLGEGMLLQEIR